MTATGEGATATRNGLPVIARPTGTFAMVATDQRESLRTIYREATGVHVDDEILRRFKVSAARVLTPLASAILVDRDYGLESILAADALDPSCGLIVAADALVQEPGGPVTDSDLDAGVVPEVALSQGAVALKLLIIWRDDQQRDRRHRLAATFIELCRDGGLLSVVEAIVRAPAGAEAGWQREPAALEAARELGALRPDLYKAEMPYLGQTEAARMEDGSRALSEAAERPWVVLSAGVPLERFEAAVEAACRGGASGFLAGRAIWSDAIALDDLEPRLQAISVPRVRRLGELVDELARPWWEATGGSS